MIRQQCGSLEHQPAGEPLLVAVLVLTSARTAGHATGEQAASEEATCSPSVILRSTTRLCFLGALAGNRSNELLLQALPVAEDRVRSATSASSRALLSRRDSITPSSSGICLQAPEGLRASAAADVARCCHHSTLWHSPTYPGATPSWHRGPLPTTGCHEDESVCMLSLDVVVRL